MEEYKHSMLTTEEKRMLSKLSSDYTDVRILHRFSIGLAPVETVIISELCVVIRTTREIVMLVECASTRTSGFISTKPYVNPISEISCGG